MSDRVGQQVGNYRLVRLLGSGGFADVYLARHVYLDSPAAIKLLRANLGQQDLDDFRGEAQTLVRLLHPHIVRLLDFGVQDGAPFLVMDYAPNGTLRQRHQRGERLALSTVVDYVDQVASGLQFAHDQKIVHRDIKPENMLLGRQQEILLSDFGIAVVAQSTRADLTRDTTGTIAYMAPEQIQAHPRPASDQYSLGIVVYEWLSGARPFAGSFTEVAAKHLMVAPPPLRELLPTVSPEVEMVVSTALAKDPKQRFSSVQAFATALHEAGQTQQTLRGVFPTFDQTLPASITPAPSRARLANPITPLPLSMPSGQQEVIVSATGETHTPAISSPRSPEANVPLNAAPGMSETSIQTEISSQTLPSAPAPMVISSPGLPPAGISFPPPPAIQGQPRPAPRAMSRRAALIAGAAAAGVVAVGGVTWFIASHASSPSTAHTTGGAQTTPTTSSSPTTAPAVVTLADDTFHRPDQIFWGTASDGLQWGGDVNTSQDCSIVARKGQIARTANGVSYYTGVLGPSFANGEVVVSGSISHYNPSHLGAILRWTDNNHYYKAFIDNQQFHLIARNGNHAPSLQTIPFAAQPNVPYTIRFHATGTSLGARVWRTGTTEPTTWMVSGTDSTFHSGQGGLRPQLDQNVTLHVNFFTIIQRATN
ncbi:MAG: protein kinase [Ktedonobacteraceae bacterium]